MNKKIFRSWYFYFSLFSVTFSIFAFILVFFIEIKPASITDDQKLLAIKQVKVEILESFLETLLFFTAAISALGAFIGASVYTFLKERIEKDINDGMDALMQIGQARTLCLSFNEFAYLNFSSYDKFLQSYLDDHEIKKSEPERYEECLKNIEAARNISYRGIETFEELSPQDQQEFLSTAKGKKAYIQIFNQYLYAITAESILRQRSPSFLRTKVRLRRGPS